MIVCVEKLNLVKNHEGCKGIKYKFHANYQRALSYSDTSGRIVDSIINFINVKLFVGFRFESSNLEINISNMKKDYQKKNGFY